MIEATPAVLPVNAPGGIRPIDVMYERERTLGCVTAHHFNAAGAALPSRAVVDAVIAHLRREEREGGYEAGAAVADQLDGLYHSAATLLGAHHDEIAVFDNASTGLRVIMDALRLGGSDRVLVSRSTYVSHALHLMTMAQERDVELIVLPNGSDGAVDLEVLADMLNSGRRDTICIAHIPTSSGLVEPVQTVGNLAARHGARYILDATQSVGQLAVDVDEIGCDALVTTGRKFLRGPRGTGLAYVRRSLFTGLWPTAPDVRGADWQTDGEWDLVDSARRFETWEASLACRLGLAVAIDELLERGVESTKDYIVNLASRVRQGLAQIPGVRVEDPRSRRSGIVTFNIDGLPAAAVKARLSAENIRVVAVPVSHGQWDLGHRGLDAVVRASVHVYNDESDVDALLDRVSALSIEAGAK